MHALGGDGADGGYTRRARAARTGASTSAAHSAVRGDVRVITLGPRGTRGAHTQGAHLARRVASVLMALATPSQFMRECLEAFSAPWRHASTCPILMCPFGIPGPFPSSFLSAIMLMLRVTPGWKTVFCNGGMNDGHGP